MSWVCANFSKKEVMRAGETLIDPLLGEEARTYAMSVLSNWRAAHAYPMHALLIFLRNKASKIDKNAIVVQRLKRTPSIISKLSRYPEMKLHRMQDISGCRAIVKTVKEVEVLASQIKTSRSRHKLHKFTDYIDQPKETGYRGIHIVYKYNGEKEDFQDYFVELQIRSRIQHAWATAVEIVDTFTDQALKASHGHADWLDFFRYASAEFARLEKKWVGPYVENIDTLQETIRLANKLQVLNRLAAFAVSAQHITKTKDNKTDYFLLELTQDATQIRATQYQSQHLSIATAHYLEKEKQASSDKSFDVVLVAASSLHALHKAYPNYFADSKEFRRLLKLVINSGS